MLPGALWAEAEGVMINSERNLTLMQKAVEPPGEALPDWQIIARIACEMGFADGFSYASAAEVFEELKGAANPRTGYDLGGASHDRLRLTPLQWPCATGSNDDRNPIRYRVGTAGDGLKFPTASGRAAFLARPHMAPAEMPDGDFPFVLNTGRLQHQWHTLTKTGKIATLNKLNPGPFVEIHPDDAAAGGIADRDRVEIRSRRGHAILPAVVTDRVRPGNCFAPFHWNDVFGEDLAINAVTIDAVDPVSQQPEFKYCAVALTRVATPAAAERPVPAAAGRDTETHRAASLAASAEKEPDMTRIAALADLLGLAAAPPITLDAQERLYMQGFVLGLGSAPVSLVPVLPVAAPFAPERRLLLDGLLAGLFSRAASPEATIEVADAAKLPAVTILWASQIGRAESFAAQSARALEAAGHPVRLAAMDQVKPTELAEAANLLMITSTFGDGEPPTTVPGCGARCGTTTRPGWARPGSPCWPSAIQAMTGSAASAAISMPGWKRWAPNAWWRGSIASPSTRPRPAPGSRP